MCCVDATIPEFLRDVVRTHDRRRLSGSGGSSCPIGTPVALQFLRRCATPVSAYKTIGVGADNVLSALESATVALEFTNPSNGAILYSTRVLSGSP